MSGVVTPVVLRLPRHWWLKKKPGAALLFLLLLPGWDGVLLAFSP